MRFIRISGLSAAAKLLVALAVPATLVVVGLRAAPAVALTDSGASDVQVNLCSQPGDASLTINAPPDRKVIEGDKALVKAAVENLLEAAFFVDDTLVTTLSLGETAFGFEQPLTLTPGVHTIKVVGRDGCRRDVATERVTITMVLPKQAAGDSGTTTKPTASTKKAGADIPDEPIVFHGTAPDPQETKDAKPEADAERGEEAGSGEAAAATPPESLAQWLDLGGTLASPANFVRATAAAAGAVAMIAAPTAGAVVLQHAVQNITNAVQQTQPKSGRRGSRTKFRFDPRYTWGLRLIGFGTLVLTFIV